jgi:hypothetical protein
LTKEFAVKDYPGTAMQKKIVIKTVKNSTSVSDYLNSIEPASARQDAKKTSVAF